MVVSAGNCRARERTSKEDKNFGFFQWNDRMMSGSSTATRGTSASRRSGNTRNVLHVVALFEISGCLSLLGRRASGSTIGCQGEGIEGEGRLGSKW